MSTKSIDVVDMECNLRTNFESLSSIYAGLVELTKKKDAEYGASWCRRGGQGAYFTMIRKFDRLETQMKARGYNILDPRGDDPSSTESLDETIKDAINYLGLILERRMAIRAELEEAAAATKAYVNQ